MNFELKDIFSVFSRRQKDQSLDEVHLLTDEFKTRLILLLKHRFKSQQHGDFFNDLIAEVHSKFQLLLGRTILSNTQRSRNEIEDALDFLESCKDSHFIDFIEYIFKSNHYGRVAHDKNKLVGELNELFLLDNLPFHLTNFTFKKEKRTVQGTRGKFEREFTSISSYPKVILRENDLIHNESVKPALTFLEDEKFKNANLEFLEALKDYRENDFGDSLTKCGSAFESVMKVICKINRWEHNQKDTASDLLETIFKNSDIPKFHKTPLITIATIRNKYSKSHGAGSKPRIATKNVTQFCINLTASSIVFLIQELT